MSKVNIKRTVENIRANTTVYSPIVEVVVNAIQAIESTGRQDGKIVVRIQRDSQMEMDSDTLPGIVGFEIVDNGIGFTPANRESFDTLYSDLKMAEGGKGFGRFICLKYFDNVHVDSIYVEEGAFKRRTFSMGKQSDIIINEKISDTAQKSSGTSLKLSGLKDGRAIDKKLNTIARNLVEKLLPNFLVETPVCPQITLTEDDGSESICLNDWFSNELSGLIKEVAVEDSKFTLRSTDTDESFIVRVFQLYFPRNQKSRISLVAHRREVSGSPLYDYVPEFVDDFYDKDGNNQAIQGRNYIIRAYVFADYLDRHVSLERGGFEFKTEHDLLYGISQVEIEKKSAQIAKEAVGADILGRQEKKKERFRMYVEEEAPWHKALVETIDLSKMPLNPSKEEIETRLQHEKFVQEVQIKRDVSRILASALTA